jgi:hypothetical protein
MLRGRPDFRSDAAIPDTCTSYMYLLSTVRHSPASSLTMILSGMSLQLFQSGNQTRNTTRVPRRNDGPHFLRIDLPLKAPQKSLVALIMFTWRLSYLLLRQSSLSLLTPANLAQKLLFATLNGSILSSSSLLSGSVAAGIRGGRVQALVCQNQFLCPVNPTKPSGPEPDPECNASVI